MKTTVATSYTELFQCRFSLLNFGGREKGSLFWQMLCQMRHKLSCCRYSIESINSVWCALANLIEIQSSSVFISSVSNHGSKDAPEVNRASIWYWMVYPEAGELRDQSHTDAHQRHLLLWQNCNYKSPHQDLGDPQILLLETIPKEPLDTPMTMIFSFRKQNEKKKRRSVSSPSVCRLQ